MEVSTSWKEVVVEFLAVASALGILGMPSVSQRSVWSEVYVQPAEDSRSLYLEV